jgi:hypothetical protein
MWLVLCDPSDHAALWAYAELRERGLAPLELISPHALLCSTSSVHRIGDRGASFEIGLPDGRKLASGDIKGVLNRWSSVPTDHLFAVSESEMHYAVEELSALVLSWLTCIGGVTINRPNPRGLPGAWRSHAEWAMLAARAGLSVPGLRLSSHRINAAPEPVAESCSLTVLGERIFGAEAPPHIAQACARLAHLADTDLLGIELHIDRARRMSFAAATALPDLRIGGRAFIEHLHHRLTDLGHESA